MSEARSESVLYRIDEQSQFAPENRTAIQANIEFVTSPDDYLIKEHFEDFRDRFTNASKQLTGRVFNRLIDNVHIPYVRHTGAIGDNPKPYPGLDVISREAAGIEPYPFKASATDYRCLKLANFAIRAGGMIDIEQTVKNGADGILFQVFTLSMIDKLKKQIIS